MADQNINIQIFDRGGDPDRSGRGVPPDSTNDPSSGRGGRGGSPPKRPNSHAPEPGDSGDDQPAENTRRKSKSRKSRSDSNQDEEESAPSLASTLGPLLSNVVMPIARTILGNNPITSALGTMADAALKTIDAGSSLLRSIPKPPAPIEITQPGIGHNVPARFGGSPSAQSIVPPRPGTVPTTVPGPAATSAGHTIPTTLSGTSGAGAGAVVGKASGATAGHAVPAVIGGASAATTSIVPSVASTATAATSTTAGAGAGAATTAAAGGAAAGAAATGAATTAAAGTAATAGAGTAAGTATLAGGIVGAGALTGPGVVIAAAVAAVVVAIGALATAAMYAKDKMLEAADGVAHFSGSMSAAKAMQDVQQMLDEIERAGKFEGEFTDLIHLQTEANHLWNQIYDEAIRAMLPIIRDILEALIAILNIIKLFAKMAPDVKTGVQQAVASVFGATGVAVHGIYRAVKWWQSKEQAKEEELGGPPEFFKAIDAELDANLKAVNEGLPLNGGLGSG